MTELKRFSGPRSKASIESVGNANRVNDIIERAQAVVARMEYHLSWDVDWHVLILALGHRPHHRDAGGSDQRAERLINIRRQFARFCAAMASMASINPTAVGCLNAIPT